MAAVDTPRRWTAREVRELVEQSALAAPRYELVDGELLVTPAPGRAHQEAVALLLTALRAYLREEHVGRALAAPFDVELEPEFLTQPDVFVLPPDEWRRLATDRVARRLLLAAEVLSPSSSRHDRVRKRPKYQRHVAEYWIVDLDARLVERWRPGDERPEILTERLAWQPAGAAQAFALDLTSYFAQALED